MQTTVTRGEIKQRAKARMKGHFREAFALNSLPIILGIVALVIAIIVSALAIAATINNPQLAAPSDLDAQTSVAEMMASNQASYGAGLISSILGALLSAGISVSSLRWLRQDADTRLERPFAQQFVGFSEFFVPFIVLFMLTSIIIDLGLIAFVIPGIILQLAYTPIYLLYADDGQHNGFFQMIGHSWRFMRGHKLDWFIFELSFIPWYIGVGLTAGLLGIYFMPYHNLAVAAFYDAIRQEELAKNELSNTDSRL
ncbi:DUF975 family protein [Lapidilactobacillus salsurivasis]